MLTWIIPPGKYVEEQVGGETVMRFYYLDELNNVGPSTGSGTSTFHAEPQTWQVFSAFYKGFVKQSNIIVFILIIGGAFWMQGHRHGHPLVSEVHQTLGTLEFDATNRSEQRRHHPYYAVVQPFR